MRPPPLKSALAINWRSLVSVWSVRSMAYPRLPQGAAGETNGRGDDTMIPRRQQSSAPIAVPPRRSLTVMIRNGYDPLLNMRQFTVPIGDWFTESAAAQDETAMQ